MKKYKGLNVKEVISTESDVLELHYGISPTGSVVPEPLLNTTPTSSFTPTTSVDPNSNIVPTGPLATAPELNSPKDPTSGDLLDDVPTGPVVSDIEDTDSSDKKSTQKKPNQKKSKSSEL